MPVVRYHLAAEVPNLAALGAGSAEDVLGLGGALLEERRAVLLARDRTSVTWRIPLPGTPDEQDEHGRLSGRPAGAGTGFVHVRRYEHASFLESAGTRFCSPRSASLAEHDWNLLCHLRKQGVSTPAPMCVAALDAPLFSPRSALVTRELQGMLSLPRWLAACTSRHERRRAARALGRMLGRIHQARVLLPKLTWEDLYLSEPSAMGEGGGCHTAAHASREHTCAAEAVSGPAVPSFAPHLRWARTQEAALARVDGGRFCASASARSLCALLRRVARARPQGIEICEREALAILLAATRQPRLRRARVHLLHALRAQPSPRR